MTPETRRQYRDDMLRNIAERDAYKSRASFNRQEYLRFRKERKWLESLKALDRWHEYKATAAKFNAEARRIREFLR